MPERTSQLTLETPRSQADTEPGGGQRRLRFGALVPTDPAGWVLVGLILLGVGLRVLTEVSWWPVATSLQDGYQIDAKLGPFYDVLHPAGYSLILAAIGSVTRQVAVPVLLQHVIGIVSALLMYAATSRVTGSKWAGLLPAAMILLGGDVIFLEHAIMSETWSILAMSVAMYSCVRACESKPRLLWPLLTGVAFAAAVVLRTEFGPLIIVAAVTVLLAKPGSAWRWRERVGAAAAVCLAAAVMLLAYAGTNAIVSGRFQIGASSGWVSYTRAAQFADCRDFTPPPGTAALCQSTPPSQRGTGVFYGFSPDSPAVRTFGSYGKHDALVGAWARRAILGQFGTWLDSVWIYLRGYWVPSSLPPNLRPPASQELSPQLAFENPNSAYTTDQLNALRIYYGDFPLHERPSGLRFLSDWQKVFRFGSTALFVTTILAALGLAIGSRRSRLGVLLFGGGGVALLAGSALLGTWAGRYTVPMAPLMVAAAAITLTEVWRAVQLRRRASRPHKTADARLGV